MLSPLYEKPNPALECKNSKHQLTYIQENTSFSRSRITKTQRINYKVCQKRQKIIDRKAWKYCRETHT